MSYTMDKDGKIKVLVPGYSGGDMENPMTTQGDIIYGGAGGAPARLGIGAADQVLTVNAGATAPEWAAAAGGGNSTHTDTYANEPAPSNDGDLFLPSNGFYLERDTGAAWAPWGPIFPLTKPPTTGWSWVNQTSGGQTGTIDMTNGGIYILAPAVAGDHWRWRVRTAPSTPYTIIACILPHIVNVNYAFVGIGWRQSSDGKAIVFGAGGEGEGTLRLSKYNSAISYAGYYGAIRFGAYNTTLFLRITDDGTNRTSSWSLDGQHFHEYNSVSRTDFLTADQVLFGACSLNGTYPAGMTLLSWEES